MYESQGFCTDILPTGYGNIAHGTDGPDKAPFVDGSYTPGDATNTFDVTTIYNEAYTVVFFSFRPYTDEAAAKKWTWSVSTTESAETVSFTVTATGGYLDSKFEGTDPYVSDRGLFLNGRTDFLSIDGLTLSSDWVMHMWIRPLGSGTLWSTNSPSDYFGEEKSIHWGVRNEAIEWEDKLRGFYYRTGTDGVNLATWNSVAVGMFFLQGRGESNLVFLRDSTSVDRVTYPFLFLDTPDIQGNKKIGALERLETLVNHYHGHIYQHSVHAGQITELLIQDILIVDTNNDRGCDYGCDRCPAGGVCLHDCPWNEYPKHDGSCHKCPTWCLNGCNMDSSC
jgi:hypothetical protein